MEAINTNQILSDMRVLAQKSGLQNTAPVNAQPAVEFGQLLKQSIQAVNQQQQVGNELARSFEMEDPKVDLATVMIEKEKANVAFQTLLHVRNRVVSAYQEVMSMPL